MDSLSLLQGIFLTQESNQDLLNCRWILYQLSYQGSPIPLLGIYPEEIIIEKHTHISVFIAALFTIARIWKQPRYPLAGKWIKVVLYIHNGILLSHKRRASFIFQLVKNLTAMKDTPVRFLGQEDSLEKE